MTQGTENERLFEANQNILQRLQEPVTIKEEVRTVVREMLGNREARVVKTACHQIEEWLESDSYEPWVREFAVELVMENAEAVEGIARSDDNLMTSWTAIGLWQTFRIYCNLAEMGEDEGVRDMASRAKTIMTEEIPNKGGIRDLDSVEGIRYVGLMSDYGSWEQKIEFGQWLKERLDGADYFENMLDAGEKEKVLAQLFEDDYCGGMADVVADYVKGMGVANYERMNYYWRQPVRPENAGRWGTKEVGMYVLRNILTMREVNRQNSDGVRWLQENNGIVHFGSWPLKMLYRQRDTPENDTPVVWMSMAVDNYNGGGWDDHELLRHLADAMEGGCQTIICEIEPEGDELHTKTKGMGQMEILNYRARNIAGREVAMAYIMVHGSKHKLHYSKNESGGIGAEKISGSGRCTLLENMTSGGLVILASCSTGTKDIDGIGKWLSNIGGVRVLGPQAPADYERIKLGMAEGRVVVEEVVARDENRRIVRVSLFDDGELVGEF